MMFPPSLPDDVTARAFTAANGELGVLPADITAFLSACRIDDVEVLGWELWIADHDWGPDNIPVLALGSWCGGIPLSSSPIPAVVGGTGNLDETARQLADFDFVGEVHPMWLGFVRVNFTLGG
jgi:hypothetical protein